VKSGLAIPIDTGNPIASPPFVSSASGDVYLARVSDIQLGKAFIQLGWI
jgi:hypothetical protein